MTSIDAPVLIGVIWKLLLGERTITQTRSNTPFIRNMIEILKYKWLKYKWLKLQYLGPIKFQNFGLKAK